VTRLPNPVSIFFVSVRAAETLAALAEPERQAWGDVADLLAKVNGGQ
jgi:hypothetical protein